MYYSSEVLQELKNFRHNLHQYPELSGKEKQTAQKIQGFLKKYPANRVLQFADTESLAFIYDSGKRGPSVLFRADIDALPVRELLDIPYSSNNPGVSHKCGHDGHTAILSGVASIVDKHPPVRGKVVLLFQAEEETGQGAAKLVNAPSFKELKIDFAFALHNLPGFPKGEVLVRESEFSAASTGMTLKFTGKPTHAAHPENGKNPAMAVSELLSFANKVAETGRYEDFVLATVIHVQLGDRAFGTAASAAEISLTLRAFKNEDLALLIKSIKETAEKLSREEGLNLKISFVEEFPATVNNPDCVQHVIRAANISGLQHKYVDDVFRWSEDFGHFTTTYKAALFGLGSGVDQPQLHNEHYDFPDDLIEPGLRIFFNIYKQILID